MKCHQYLKETVCATVDHVVVCNAGYLFDARVESIAPGTLFTRMLAHRDDVGLTPAQVTGLLNLTREYHERQLQLVMEFMELRERLEIKHGRVTSEDLSARERLLDQHAQLFREHEALFFEFASRGHALLSDEQIAAAESVYYREFESTLAKLGPILSRATAAHEGTNSKELAALS